MQNGKRGKGEREMERARGEGWKWKEQKQKTYYLLIMWIFNDSVEKLPIIGIIKEATLIFGFGGQVKKRNSQLSLRSTGRARGRDKREGR